jgi:membrane-associated phospholipid phosphatase
LIAARTNLGKIAFFLLAACALILAAAATDVRVAAWVHARDLGPRVRASRIAWFIKSPGDFRSTLILAAALIAINFKYWRSAVLLALSGITAGLFYSIVKWTAGRTRPFPRHAAFVPAFELHPFPLGLRGLWNADNLAFPSGHACLAFATAMALSMVFPRGKWWFFLAALAVGAERVLEGAHYPSDVAGAAILGIAAAYLSALILRKLEERQLRRQTSGDAAVASPTIDRDNVARSASVVRMDSARGSAVGQ